MNKERDLKSIYMHTSSGRKYFPFAPGPDQIDVNVIAHHLATRARWNGATQHKLHPSRIFYSVAEHSVYVMRWVEEIASDVEIAKLTIHNREELALMALLHDGSESFNGDLIRPLKYSKEFSKPFKKVESMSETAIAKRFDFPVELPSIVKVGDDAVCAAESRQIVPKDPCEEWSSGSCHSEEVVAPFEIEMLPPYEAKLLFLHHFKRLTGAA